ncbi:hypothetical protein ACWEHA_01070 [Amycolatopsis nivea]
MSRAQKLAQDAAEAAEVRAYQTDPDVVALRIERVRRQVDWMAWSGIVLGLGFTMTNVQTFASADTAVWSLPWLAAWVLDPTVSLVLLAILRAEQVTARYQVRTGTWVRRAKWFTLAATYVMNTWTSFMAGEAAAIVLHSVPPLVVFVAVEAVTDLRDKLTDAVLVAAGERRVVRAVEGGRRKLFADYLSEARAAWAPGVEITPAWVRQETGCSRGLSPRLARTLRAEVANG